MNSFVLHSIYCRHIADTSRGNVVSLLDIHRALTLVWNKEERVRDTALQYITILKQHTRIHLPDKRYIQSNAQPADSQARARFSIKPRD